MITKNNALERIQEIHQVIQQSLLFTLPGKLLMAIGTGITLIPLVEWLLHSFIDPVLVSYGATDAIIFVLRTIFYWSSFSILSTYFHSNNEMHPAIKKAWGLNLLFPLIPVSTAAMLSLAGYSELIMPIVLILIGCFWALVGRFTSTIITALACIYLIIGIGSIYLATLSIPHFWMYLLEVQGIGCIVAGIALHLQQKS